jgi:hypothetical protein
VLLWPVQGSRGEHSVLGADLRGKGSLGEKEHQIQVDMPPNLASFLCFMVVCMCVCVRDYKPLKRTTGEEEMSEWSMRSNSISSVSIDRCTIPSPPLLTPFLGSYLILMCVCVSAVCRLVVPVVGAGV